MTWRHRTAWAVGAVLIGMGATILWAQPPREDAARGDRARLRASIVRLRTEAEMLRLDYEAARDGVLEELKLERGLRMAGSAMGIGLAIESAVSGGDEAKAARAEAAKARVTEYAKAQGDDAAFLAERKTKLAPLFARLAETRLDLEDAERAYREPLR
jgi:hypothetical protein